VAGVAEAISQSIDADLQAPGVVDVTATQEAGSSSESRTTCCLTDSRQLAGARCREEGSCFHCRQSPGVEDARRDRSTLVCTAITCNESFKRRLLDAVRGPAEFRARPDHAVELASTTRRQHRRILFRQAFQSVTL
jgi:hypothetical protein